MFLPEGDANTKIFHLQSCHRGRQNLVTHLIHDNMTVVDESEKAHVVFQHFDQVLGCYEQRSHRLDLNTIGLPSNSLPGLDHCFTTEEIWRKFVACPLMEHRVRTVSRTTFTNSKCSTNVFFIGFGLTSVGQFQ
jgi:hypothetical protein